MLEGNPFASPPTLPVAAILGDFEQPVFPIDTGRESVEISGYVDLDGTTCIVLNQYVVELAEQGQADVIGETLVDMTIFDGNIVFEREQAMTP